MAQPTHHFDCRIQRLPPAYNWSVHLALQGLYNGASSLAPRRAGPSQTDNDKRLFDRQSKRKD
jgi:hypothetical protein